MKFLVSRLKVSVVFENKKAINIAFPSGSSAVQFSINDSSSSSLQLYHIPKPPILPSASCSTMKVSFAIW